MTPPKTGSDDGLIQNVMIGGNHLASALLTTADPAQYRRLSYYDVLEKHGQPYADMFVAWKAIMELRDKSRHPSDDADHAGKVDFTTVIGGFADWESEAYSRGVAINDEDVEKLELFFDYLASRNLINSTDNGRG